MTIEIPNGTYSGSSHTTLQQGEPIRISDIPLRPAGWKILVKMYRAPEKIGLLFTPETTQADESVASLMARVIEVGPVCYSDEKYLGEVWCKAGDVVIMKSYSGVRLKIGNNGDEYRLINEDSIDAVITDESRIPEITRAY